MNDEETSVGTPGDISAAATRPDLYRELQRAAETHLALLYSGRQEQLDAALSFIQIGLENDEQCLYITAENSREDIIDGLETLGVDATSARRYGQLRVVPYSDISRDTFGEGWQETLFGNETDETTPDTGVRVTAERNQRDRGNSNGGKGVQSVCRQVPDRTVLLCQYDLRNIDDSDVAEVLQTHERFIFRRRVCDNPYFDPTASSESRSQIAANQLLDTAYELTTAQDAIELREQRVTVLNRVLRHNLRNELNVIQSHVELLQDSMTDPSQQESLETILETSGRLMGIADDAKRVEKSVSQSATDRVPVDLKRVLEHAAEQVQHPDVVLTLPVDGSRWVEASDELEFAFVELFEALTENARDGSEILVTFDDDCSTHVRQCLRIEYRGTTLPDAEVDALVRGSETQLSHGSGIGLWLVNWIVELSGGQLAFERKESGREEVVLTFITA